MEIITHRFIPGVVAALALLAYPLSARAAEAPKPPPAPQAGKGPIKVFLLAGQSNMEGQGAIDGDKETLQALVKDPATAARYKHLIDKDGKWVVRNDVWCSYDNKGALTAGVFAGAGCMGPELGFGWEVGHYLDNQVLLLYEFCEDYISSAYSPDDKLDPKVLIQSNRRVSRGGCWRKSPEQCRSAARSTVRQGIGGPWNGFRVAVQAE
ncbi:MAG: sialate O-acetylesterase [Verrucomicrobiota bacterium]